MREVGDVTKWWFCCKKEVGGVTECRWSWVIVLWRVKGERVSVLQGVEGKGDNGRIGWGDTVRLGRD
mgnify:CR=1 FL=1